MAGFLNPKVRRQKFGVGSLIILLVFGVVFTGAGLLIIKSSRIDPSWTKVTGRIVSSSTHINNGSTTYAPVVQYQVGEQLYTVTGSISSSAYPAIGSQRQIAYNPAQPQNAKVVEGASSKVFLYIFPAIGIGLLLFAPIAFVRSLRRNGDITNLVQTGQKLQGVLTDIQTSFGANNASSYKVVVSATDSTGSVQTYISDSLTGIGGLAMADFRTHPIPIDVYVNPANPKDYYVDVSDVPNLTPDRIASLLQSATGQQVNTFAGGEQPNVASPTQPPEQPKPPLG